jgi:hypothetical protein
MLVLLIFFFISVHLYDYKVINAYELTRISMARSQAAYDPTIAEVSVRAAYDHGS